MRYEAKTEEEAVAGAARALGRPASELKYTVIRDEKAFWGGRVVEIEVDAPAPGEAQREAEKLEDEPTFAATPPEAALATSVLLGLCLIVIGAPGGLIWLADWDIARSAPSLAPPLPVGATGQRKSPFSRKNAE